VALLFPGQGSQALGMISDEAAALPAVSALLAEAAEVLGYNLLQLIKEGEPGGCRLLSSQQRICSPDAANLRKSLLDAADGSDQVVTHQILPLLQPPTTWGL
jgi:malonyl CoA-acyl carrier protein transacylase